MNPQDAELLQKYDEVLPLLTAAIKQTSLPPHAGPQPGNNLQPQLEAAHHEIRELRQENYRLKGALLHLEEEKQVLLQHSREKDLVIEQQHVDYSSTLQELIRVRKELMCAQEELNRVHSGQIRLRELPPSDKWRHERH
jgi:hypothetical protein